MSVTQSPLENNPTDIQRCTRCNNELPPQATFCGNCGERVPESQRENPPVLHSNIKDLYRITTLARRSANSQVFFAIDQQQKPLAINDLDISQLDERARAQASKAMQKEYDAIRLLKMPAFMPLINLHIMEDHFYIVAEWPQSARKRNKSAPLGTKSLETLHALLQSGIGLPEEQVAIAWIYRLSRTIEELHKKTIVIGDIDPEIVIVNERSYQGEPALTMSWLPESMQQFFPHSLSNTNSMPFYAPEMLQGEREPRSDIYSLGAILYLLLTGIQPEDAQTRVYRPLRPLRAIDPELGNDTEMVVMRALALKKEERYDDAHAFSEALLQLLTNPEEEPLVVAEQTTGVLREKREEINIVSESADNKNEAKKQVQEETENNDVTVSIVPLQAQMARRYLTKLQTSILEKPVHGEALVEGQKNKKDAVKLSAEEQENKNKQHGTTAIEDIAMNDLAEKPAQDPSDLSGEADIAELPTRLVALDVDTRKQIQDESAIQQKNPNEGLEKKEIAEASKDDRPQIVSEAQTPDEVSKHTTRALIPSSPRELTISRVKNILASSLTTLPRLLPAYNDAHTEDQNGTDNKAATILKHVRRFVLGEPQNNTSAAALIETPMRVQPNQTYSIRINVIGRNKTQGEQAGGLSSMTEGEKIHVEVRSALYQHYAYVIQQADVVMPGDGLVAELMMPMQPLFSGPSGRRERLHIFFMDEKRNPLYEKPFVIEIFVSHLVQSGREGHNVLSLPI